MRCLLDVNVLIALIDPSHAFHSRAHQWWRKSQPAWASCPITENGLVRITSAVNYSKIFRFTVAELTTLFQTFVEAFDHAFWPDTISLRDPACFDHRRILSSRQITDTYLLALAVKNGGLLVTFDHGISPVAAVGAQGRHVLVL